MDKDSLITRFIDENLSEITPIPDIQTATVADRDVTCTVTALTSPGTFSWKQDGSAIISDSTNYIIKSDSTLSSNEQKSVLIVTVGGMTGLSLTSTFTCIFTSGEIPTSPVGEESFDFKKLTYSKQSADH